jgi:hypothetical protein
MREYCEKQITVGFTRDSKKVFDEIEQVVAKMNRENWILDDSVADELLDSVSLMFSREIDIS